MQKKSRRDKMRCGTSRFIVTIENQDGDYKKEISARNQIEVRRICKRTLPQDDRLVRVQKKEDK